jgi:hypothetical protein
VTILTASEESLEYTPAKFLRDQGLIQDTIEANDGRANLLYSSGRKAMPSGKIRVHPQANAPAADSLIKSSARTRQTAQNHMTMAYASTPLMLAIDRRIFDIPLEERLQPEHLSSSLGHVIAFLNLNSKV